MGKQRDRNSKTAKTKQNIENKSAKVEMKNSFYGLTNKMESSEERIFELGNIRNF